MDADQSRMTKPSRLSRAMRATKLIYVTMHAAYFVGRALVGLLVGFAMGGAGGEGPMHTRAPETGPMWSEDFDTSALVVGMFISIILPLLRRRFDLLSMAGSFIIVALLWIQVDLSEKLVYGDPHFARFAAKLYTAFVAAPFTALAVCYTILRRRAVGAAKNSARGPCPGCGFDRSSVDPLARCPECDAISAAVKLLETI